MVPTVAGVAGSGVGDPLMFSATAAIHAASDADAATSSPSRAARVEA